MSAFRERLKLTAEIDDKAAREVVSALIVSPELLDEIEMDLFWRARINTRLRLLGGFLNQERRVERGDGERELSDFLISRLFSFAEFHAFVLACLSKDRIEILSSLPFGNFNVRDFFDSFVDYFVKSGKIKDDYLWDGLLYMWPGVEEEILAIKGKFVY